MSFHTAPRLFFVSALACSISVLAAETPPPPKPGAGAQTDGKDKPFIIHNPDGTMTVQTAPSSGKTGAAQKGLTVSPQVVVPTARQPANDPPNQAH